MPFCVWQVFEAGLFGAVHKGNYKSGWKTLLFIGSCFLATVATFVGFALLMRHLIDESIDIADAHNMSEYVRLNVPDEYVRFFALSTFLVQFSFMCMTSQQCVLSCFAARTRM